MLNGLLHQCQRVFGQQLQDANVLPGSGHRAMPLLEVFPHPGEAGRQSPSIEHEGMIQSRRPATEDGQIVTRLDDPFAPGVTSPVRGDDALRRDHIDPIDIGLDRRRGKGPTTGNAVTIGVEPHSLIFVHLGRGRDKRVKGMGRQRQRRLFILREQFPDRLGLARHTVVQPGQGAPPQIRVELG